jgi:GR25 family glycosyltransferase involved in LPS biosynthesis/2-polyprenyl-3-methyl-5-hydroxy-6-metoxy-1,4-benzoquinol methylase
MDREEKNFSIISGYRHRQNTIYFDDTGLTDEWQREVYFAARDLMLHHSLSTVYDVGCGSGYKLMNYLGQYDTTGFDVPETVAYLKKTYPDRKWFAGTEARGLPKADLVICADVLEHVLDPDQLLDFIGRIANGYIVLSTPDRGLLYPSESDRFLGPPQNPAHIREWTFSEFATYIARHFEIVSHRISNSAQATQMVICKPKRAKQAHEARIFNQVHVVNLDASVERFNTFKKRNFHLKDVVRVSAVDGRTVDRAKLAEEGIIASDLKYSPGSIGCALSHIGLWKKAVAEQRVINVFEDDVVCAPTFGERAAEVVAQIPAEWDIILWGFNYDPLFVWLDLGFSRAKLEFYNRIWSGSSGEFATAAFASVPMKIAHCFGTLGYSITPRGAGILLEHCIPLRNQLIPFPGTDIVIDDTGIDCSMCGAYPSMQAFACLPPLVLHDNAQSSDRIDADRQS